MVLCQILPMVARSSNEGVEIHYIPALQLRLEEDLTRQTSVR